MTLHVNMSQIIREIDKQRQESAEQLREKMYFTLSSIAEKEREVRVGLEAEKELKELKSKLNKMIADYQEIK